MYAAGYGKFEIFERLLYHGANLAIRDGQGRSVLSYAAGAYRLSGSSQAIDLLLQHVADATADCTTSYVDQCDSLGRSPLSYAAENGSFGSFETIEHLIRCGANPKAIDHNGRSILSYYCRSFPSDFHKTIDLLLRHGADPWQEDCMGRSAISYAAGSRTKQLFEFLLWSSSSDLLAGKEYSDDDRRKQIESTLMLRSAEIHKLDEHGGTPLSYAAEAENWKAHPRSGSPGRHR